MASALAATFVSVFIVSLISFVGALTLFVGKNKIQKLLIYLVGFSAGALIGDAFLHLIPEAAVNGHTIAISIYIIVGILFSFVIEKMLHWRHYHHLDHLKEEKKSKRKVKKIKMLGYMNLFGDALHNFLDGIVIGASYLVSFPVGLATTLAVVFHEIPQELGDFGVLLHSGFSGKKALIFNFLSACLAILGGLIAVWFVGKAENLLVFLIPFTAGNFNYIAGSNLIPELQKEPRFRKSFIQLVSLIVGIVVMVALLFVG